jgi:Predicted AAA-ATPase/PD-(D/E)XK nuclease superfamily
MKSVIGYSEADFKTLREDKSLYIDRTAFIETMENQSNKNLIFVRPRRFGKSLWLSILHYYYGVEHKDLFEPLFGNLAIGQNPTPLRNTYLVLTFQFSGIDVETNLTTYKGFRQNVITGIIDCMTAYPNYFSGENKAEIKALDTPASMIQTFFSFYKANRVPYPIYILIDEYDQFANELVGLDTERFKSIIGGSGFVRKFYEMIKNAANGGVVNRFFATGVSPLTVDAMTSGFNISTSIALDLEFHDLMGFKRDEVAFILKQVGAKEENIPLLITVLKDWYDGYLFHVEATERLYNSDMIMYFASNYEKKQRYPEIMLDANIATDYKKVKRIFNIQEREEEFIPILKELTTEGVLTAQITRFFNLEDDFTDEDIISLLYYMGWITILDKEEGLHRFKMPNQVIIELYHDYFVNIVERETGLNRKVSIIRKALKELAANNNPHPFLEIIRVLIEKDLSLRDAQGFDEKHLKMLIIPYLSLSATHYVVSEPEWEKLYPDIVLKKRPNIETRYNFLIELKYIKMADENKDDKDSKERIIAKVEKEARLQIQKYIQTENAKRIPNLKAWLLILVGRKWHLVEEIPVIYTPSV